MDLELTALRPCLNEADRLPSCSRNGQQAVRERQISLLYLSRRRR